MNDFECCPDWKPQCEKVNGPIVMSFIRTGNQYDGLPFRFCPWCGTKRPEPKPESEPKHE
jgi:hypothetical protein